MEVALHPNCFMLVEEFLVSIRWTIVNTWNSSKLMWIWNLRVWWWRLWRLYLCGMWDCVVWWINTNILEEHANSIFTVLWILWRIPEIGTIITYNVIHWRCMLSVARWSWKQVCFFFLINAPWSDSNVDVLYVAQTVCLYLHISVGH
jgi:hypothetical protein